MILGAFCTIFRAGRVWKGLGAQFGRKTTENQPKLKFTFEFLIMTATTTRICWQGTECLVARPTDRWDLASAGTLSPKVH